MAYLIRLARPSDGEALAGIYAPYVTQTAVSFETEPPGAAEFAARIEATGGHYPFLACQSGSQVVGYAYAARHREREAYRFDVDLSIYVLPAHHGLGAAHGLYGCLLHLLEALGYRNAYAAYTVPNEKSRRFHEKFGFAVIGTHHATGYKFGQWHDVTWLEKRIGGMDATPLPPRPIREIQPGRLDMILSSYGRP